MAGNSRAFANSNVMLVRNESSSDMSIVAMLASCSPVALQVQRGGGGSLEDAIANCGQKRAYYPMFEASGEDPGEEDLGDDCTQQVEKKRRLTFDQVRALEKNFEVENKLEPERKMQLAKELGLQPRQVAVWFQNRRARWKIKQLERDYELLSSDFNRLKHDYDAVLQEKEELEGERAYLAEKMQSAEPGGQAADLPEKAPTKRSEVECAQEGEKGKEPGVGNKGVKEASSESISSELENSDSPRTSMDSGGGVLAVPPLESISAAVVEMGDLLGDQLLASLHGCHRISVKLEDGSFQDESCNYMLAQLDEDRGLPWWDWAA